MALAPSRIKRAAGILPAPGGWKQADLQCPCVLQIDQCREPADVRSACFLASSCRLWESQRCRYPLPAPCQQLSGSTLRAVLSLCVSAITQSAVVIAAACRYHCVRHSGRPEASLYMPGWRGQSARARTRAGARHLAATVFPDALQPRVSPTRRQHDRCSSRIGHDRFLLRRQFLCRAIRLYPCVPVSRTSRIFTAIPARREATTSLPTAVPGPP